MILVAGFFIVVDEMRSLSLNERVQPPRAVRATAALPSLYFGVLCEWAAPVGWHKLFIIVVSRGGRSFKKTQLRFSEDNYTLKITIIWR